MTGRSLPLPQWLQASLDPAHISAAVRDLEKREAIRATARIPPRAQVRYSSNAAARLQEEYSCGTSQWPDNRPANRYYGIDPYDRTRVLVPNPPIETGRSEAAGDAIAEPRYINANWVRELVGGKWWIAAQAPLPDTAHAFLTLAMTPNAPQPSALRGSQPPRAQRVHTIIQLTRWVEKNSRRADPYFGDQLNKVHTVYPDVDCSAPPIHVRVLKAEKIEEAQCVSSVLELRWAGNDEEVYKVTHLLYSSWPDFGVPNDDASVLALARLAQNVNNKHSSRGNEDPNESPPMIVHCSAGVGRTGTFLAFCSLLRGYNFLNSSRGPGLPRSSVAPPMAESILGPLPAAYQNDLLAQEVDSLREQRQSMLQKPEQVIWIYSAFRDVFDS